MKLNIYWKEVLELIENFENSLKFHGERYICKLIWKDNMGMQKRTKNYKK